MANSFDDKSTQRIARTVRLVEKSPLNSPTYRRRSRSRSVSPEVAAGGEPDFKSDLFSFCGICKKLKNVSILAINPAQLFKIYKHQDRRNS